MRVSFLPLISSDINLHFLPCIFNSRTISLSSSSVNLTFLDSLIKLSVVGFASLCFFYSFFDFMIYFLNFLTSEFSSLWSSALFIFLPLLLQESEEPYSNEWDILITEQEEEDSLSIFRTDITIFFYLWNIFLLFWFLF